MVSAPTIRRYVSGVEAESDRCKHRVSTCEGRSPVNDGGRELNPVPCHPEGELGRRTKARHPWITRWECRRVSVKEPEPRVLIHSVDQHGLARHPGCQIQRELKACPVPRNRDPDDVQVRGCRCIPGADLERIAGRIGDSVLKPFAEAGAAKAVALTTRMASPARSAAPRTSFFMWTSFGRCPLDACRRAKRMQPKPRCAGDPNHPFVLHGLQRARPMSRFGQRRIGRVQRLEPRPHAVRRGSRFCPGGLLPRSTHKEL